MTEEQKKIVPYAAWWENNRKGIEYIKQYQKQPLTVEEILAWQKKIDKEAGISNPFCGMSFNQLKEMERG